MDKSKSDAHAGNAVKCKQTDRAIISALIVDLNYEDNDVEKMPASTRLFGGYRGRPYRPIIRSTGKPEAVGALGGG
jgi:hypothetical protein